MHSQPANVNNLLAAAQQGLPFRPVQDDKNLLLRASVLCAPECREHAT